MKFINLFLLPIGVMILPVAVFSQANGVQPNSDTIPHTKPHKEFKKIYDEFKVDGLFALYNLQDSSYLIYNPVYYRQPVSPASTFNILLALIGLQEGVIGDENSTLQPDTTTLAYAFRHNVDSFFIKLSARIGREKIARWLRSVQYGNKTTAGEEGRFWINGRLQITPEQQLRFIQDFYFEKFPFSTCAFAVVKQLMDETTNGGLAVKIFGKRGSNKLYQKNEYTASLYKEDKYAGWFVGYVEGKRNTYFFVNYLQSSNLQHPGLVKAQKEIAFKLIKQLGLQ